MKIRQLLSVISAFCGVMAFTATQAMAQPNENKAFPGPGTVYVSTIGLKTGSVDIKITNDGKTYYFTSYGSSVPGQHEVGSFPVTGSYFDIEITPHTDQSFWCFGGSPLFHFAPPESYSSRVTWDKFTVDPSLAIVFRDR